MHTSSQSLLAEHLGITKPVSRLFRGYDKFGPEYLAGINLELFTVIATVSIDKTIWRKTMYFPWTIDISGSLWHYSRQLRPDITVKLFQQSNINYNFLVNPPFQAKCGKQKFTCLHFNKRQSSGIRRNCMAAHYNASDAARIQTALSIEFCLLESGI